MGAGRLGGSVLLVGSMPFNDVEQMFRAAGPALGATVGCLPDGEVAERTNWVGMLPEYIYRKHPDLEETLAPPGHRLVQPDRDAQGPPLEEIPGIWNFRVKPGVDLRFDDLGYGRPAVASYRVFTRLRDEGVVDAGVKFQLCLPSPCSGTEWNFEDPDQWPMVRKAYRDELRREVDAVLAEVPADDLVVQWDVAWEFVDLGIGDKRLFAFYPHASVEEKFERYAAQLDDLGDGIPDETVLGFHWCYGTWGGWPMVAMGDVGLCVRMSNEAVRRIGRTVDYVHMPVTRNPEASFFAPLDDLDVGDTRVYLVQRRISPSGV